jgi:RNA polymerase sigma-70 factor (ECF subfamily)
MTRAISMAIPVETKSPSDPRRGRTDGPPTSPHAGKPSDADLFAAIAAGDLGPLGTLFDRYHGDVRSFLVRSAPRASDVDDLVQETFLTAARAAGAYDGRDRAGPFLVGVAAQLLRRKRRSFARLRAMLENLGRAPVDEVRDPEASAVASGESARVQAAMERLSEDRRVVLVMVEWNGMSGVEVARALDIPVGTVWRRLHEARAELKKALERGQR